MNKLFAGLMFLLILGSVCFAAWTYDYNVEETVTSGSMTHVDVSALGETSSILIINDSVTNEVYVNWDGRATNEADVLSFGFQLKAEEYEVRDLHTERGPKLACATTESAAVRIGIIF